MKEILEKLVPFYEPEAFGNEIMLENLADILAAAKRAGVRVSVLFHPVVTVRCTPETKVAVARTEDELDSVVGLKRTIDMGGGGHGWAQYEVA